MTDNIIQFYQEQIRKFTELKKTCSYPERVEYLIQSYEEEIQKIGDYDGKPKTERQATL